MNEPSAQKSAGIDRIPAEFETFLSISDCWNLTSDEQITLLGSPGRSTYFKWKKVGGSLPNDTAERLSHLLGVIKSLRILFTNDKHGDEWLRRPNEFFDGRSALDVMLDGKLTDIYRVRQYLDAQRGG